MNESPPIVLSFAATDPTNGAGLQADSLTLASMGCHPVSVVTAITIQDTTGVEDFLAIDSEWVTDQARCLLEDIPVSVFKIGMLGSLDNIAAIAEILADYPDIPVVFDPVLTSGKGDEFATEEMVAALRGLLIPQTTIITPNSIEARRLALSDQHEHDDPTLEESAMRILAMGCEYALITGTHENTRAVTNVLYGQQGKILVHHWDRLANSYHGSGCTLASAIAAGLANGSSLNQAVAEAEEFTYETLKAGFRPGMGQYIPDRLFWAQNDETNSATSENTASEK